jgi:hypothetical protein
MSEPEGESNGAEGGTRTPTVLLPPALKLVEMLC